MKLHNFGFDRLMFTVFASFIFACVRANQTGRQFFVLQFILIYSHDFCVLGLSFGTVKYDRNVLYRGTGLLGHLTQTLQLVIEKFFRISNTFRSVSLLKSFSFFFSKYFFCHIKNVCEIRSCESPMPCDPFFCSCNICSNQLVSSGASLDLCDNVVCLKMSYA